MKPIIFDAESVRAILAGRKTQTRRVVKPQPERRVDAWRTQAGEWRGQFRMPAISCCLNGLLCDVATGYYCPFGGRRSRLWVKESGYWNGGAWCYRADFRDEIAKGIRWRNPLFMPRVSSRLTLEIVSVRVERVQAIATSDIRAEGLELLGTYPACMYEETQAMTRLFAARWDALNAKRGYPWESNPWVFAIKFRTITPTAADAAGD